MNGCLARPLRKLLVCIVVYFVSNCRQFGQSMLDADDDIDLKLKYGFCHSDTQTSSTAALQVNPIYEKENLQVNFIFNFSIIIFFIPPENPLYSMCVYQRALSTYVPHHRFSLHPNFHWPYCATKQSKAFCC